MEGGKTGERRGDEAAAAGAVRQRSVECTHCGAIHGGHGHLLARSTGAEESTDELLLDSRQRQRRWQARRATRVSIRTGPARSEAVGWLHGPGVEEAGRHDG